jgi:hypothetical protein
VAAREEATAAVPRGGVRAVVQMAAAERAVVEAKVVLAVGMVAAVTAGGRVDLVERAAVMADAVGMVVSLALKVVGMVGSVAARVARVASAGGMEDWAEMVKAAVGREAVVEARETGVEEEVAAAQIRVEKVGQRVEAQAATVVAVLLEEREAMEVVAD